jgi:uncharacterized delta-60 repeat protein
LPALCASLVLGVGSAQATPGALDPSFGVGGTEEVPIGVYPDQALAVRLQPDGKIVAAGGSFSGSAEEFALVRLNPSGTLDTGFSADGKVTTLIGSGGEATALAVQSDGKLVAAGYSHDATTGNNFTLVRYKPNGSLDTGFGGKAPDVPGTVTTDIGGADDDAFAVALQPDGKIVAAGQTFNGSNYDFALVRYNVNGSLDTTFGAGGGSETPIGAHDDVAEAVALQPDGKIVAAGYSNSSTTGDNFAVVRYNANGFPDSSFGTNGKVTTSLGSSTDRALAVAVQADGKVVAAGFSSNGANDDFAVVRYNANGSLDTTFGTGGKETIPLGSADDVAFAVALQPDGKIVLAGKSEKASAADEIGVVRLNANGSLDPGFGSGGKVIAPIGTDGIADSVALQPDGKIVAAGSADFGSGYDFAFARFLGNTLTVTKAGTGEGTVSSSPAGIDCGSTCTAPLAAVPVTLAATPQPGSVFDGWSGGGCFGTIACHVQLSNDAQVTATFTLVKTLTVTESGAGTGTVTSKPGGIVCGSGCSHAFPAGSLVTLTAKADRGATRFTGWTGACSGTDGRVCTLTMDADHDVTATFRQLCIVPNVKGKTLARAKRVIKAASCTVGTITLAFSTSVRKGRVISQKPNAGSQHLAGSAVKLTVSKGRY